MTSLPILVPQVFCILVADSVGLSLEEIPLSNYKMPVTFSYRVWNAAARRYRKFNHCITYLFPLSEETLLCQFGLWELTRFNLFEDCSFTSTPVDGRPWQPLSDSQCEKYRRWWAARLGKGVDLCIIPYSLFSALPKISLLESEVRYLVSGCAAGGNCIWTFNPVYSSTKARMSFQLINTNKIVARSSSLLHLAVLSFHLYQSK